MPKNKCIFNALTVLALYNIIFHHIYTYNSVDPFTYITNIVHKATMFSHTIVSHVININITFS